jgi:hypothetical protein
MGLLDRSDVAPAKSIEVEDEEKKKQIVSNPAFEVWHAREQTVMGYLLKSCPKICSPTSLVSSTLLKFGRQSRSSSPPNPVLE